jgi:cold shock protein
MSKVLVRPRPMRLGIMIVEYAPESVTLWPGRCEVAPQAKRGAFTYLRSTPERNKEAAMAKGTVKWFNSQKGYGFIQPQAGGKDVFVHISAVERAGLSGLNEGQVVEYEEVSNKGKTSAENLKVQR